jgi:predicted CXXCH cytochrome family protein
MSGRDRLSWAAPAGAALVCLLGVYAARVTSQEPADAEQVELLYPPAGSVLPSGNFDVICRAPEGVLEVDGEVFRWEPFEPPLRVAHVSLYSGMNQLRIGRHQVDVFVARTAEEPGGPEGWPLVHSHPLSGSGAKRCAACHQTQQQSETVRLGELKSYEACFECHRAVEFEAIHTHPLEPLEPCQMCHGLHRSEREALLKAPIKKLCAECHES